ncbi:MAG: thioesterase family protein [Desulfobacterales bacterium]|jgi:acyl-CoA thioester hydrolase
MPSQTPLAPFYHPVRVRFADTDLQGHAFFGSYYTYMDEGFLACIRELGCSWQTLGAMNREIVYVDSGCRFTGRCYFEDSLRVHTAITRIGTTSLTAEMVIVRSHDESTVANGFITGVVVNRKTGKPAPVPAILREAAQVSTGGGRQ